MKPQMTMIRIERSVLRRLRFIQRRGQTDSEAIDQLLKKVHAQNPA